MSLIKRLFGGAPKPDLATPSQLDGRPDSKPFEDSQATTRRELVRVVTRDTLRDTGIPDGWIESDMLMEIDRSGHPCIHLRLVVKRWDPRILKYTVAFQRRLQLELEAFDPGARDWLLSTTWQFQADSECPFLEMPDPSTWAGPAFAPTVPKGEARDELQEDLAQLYAVRDANLAEQSPDSRAREGGSKKAPIIPDVLI